MAVEVYGISGTNGAGKDELAKVLAEKYGFFVASATDMLAEGLREKGWPIDREHKAKLSAEWRRQYGMSAVVDRAYKAYQPVKDQYKGFAVGSLRHPGEAERIHELGGLVIWLDADEHIRYERVTNAGTRNNKDAEDSVTFEEFVAQQEREMHPIGDSATLNIAGVKELSDITILNDGNNRDEFVNLVGQELGLAA